MIGIYKIENDINHKLYIGQSVDIERRWSNHRAHIYDSRNDNLPLYRAIRKYGIENFSFSIIELCKKEELNEKEKYYIKKYNTLAPDGYNATLGGQCSVPRKITLEQAKEIIHLLKTTTLNQTQIAEQFGISQNAVSDINTGCCWIDENETYPIRRKRFLHNDKGEYQKSKVWKCVDCGKIVTKGAKRCERCNRKFQSKAERPSREKLKEEIRNNSFVQLGKNYGVTDNTIRKWCKAYNLPFKAKDIKQYTDEEWDAI